MCFSQIGRGGINLNGGGRSHRDYLGRDVVSELRRVGRLRSEKKTGKHGASQCQILGDPILPRWGRPR